MLTATYMCRPYKGYAISYTCIWSTNVVAGNIRLYEYGNE